MVSLCTGVFLLQPGWALDTNMPFTKNLHDNRHLFHVIKVKKWMKSWKRMKPHKKFSLLIYYQTQIPLVAVHTVMQKPTPPVLDFIPTSFVSKVDHLRHLFAFLSYQKFCEIVLKYLSDFLFEKHRSDIEHALTILWEECKGYALSQPPIEPDKDENSSFPNSWYDIDDLNSPRPVLCVDTTASYLPWREVDKGQQGVYGGH
eukprot:TRINITY_DN11391_c0_g1_i11.p1 TRINITY_DN11391_c0_g1~~TRINITY_DN11391_c0_g1_i11.p1  ORF type:complete len:202 (-),score=11.85 TRINITY_DN11391_c0_g1_i11:23-628(-)